MSDTYEFKGKTDLIYSRQFPILNKRFQVLKEEEEEGKFDRFEF